MLVAAPLLVVTPLLVNGVEVHLVWDWEVGEGEERDMGET